MKTLKMMGLLFIFSVLNGCAEENGTIDFSDFGSIPAVISATRHSTAELENIHVNLAYKGEKPIFDKFWGSEYTLYVPSGTCIKLNLTDYPHSWIEYAFEGSEFTNYFNNCVGGIIPTTPSYEAIRPHEYSHSTVFSAGNNSISFDQPVLIKAARGEAIKYDNSDAFSYHSLIVPKEALEE